MAVVSRVAWLAVVVAVVAVVAGVAVVAVVAQVSDDMGASVAVAAIAFGSLALRVFENLFVLSCAWWVGLSFCAPSASYGMVYGSWYRCGLVRGKVRMTPENHDEDQESKPK